MRIETENSNKINMSSYLEAVRLLAIVCSCDLYNVITPKDNTMSFQVTLIIIGDNKEESGRRGLSLLSVDVIGWKGRLDY